MNLLENGVHNFIEGLIMIVAFITSIHLGIVTTLAVALHEIPQEISELGVLMYEKFKKTRALFPNFITALTGVSGGIFGFYLAGFVGPAMLHLLPFVAGGFIYIVASNLIPEIRKDARLRRSLISFGIFILGILIMFGVKLLGIG